MSSPRTTLILAALILGVLALLPRPYLRGVTHLNRPVMFLLAPVQQPSRTLIVWLQTPSRNSGLDAAPVPDPDALAREIDRLRHELLQSKQEADDLRNLVRDLSRAVQHNPTLAVRMIPAPVIGFGSDLSGGLLTVRAGRREGVETNAVVVVRGVYLVGRVTRTDERTCAVLPINDPAFAKSGGGAAGGRNLKFSGVIMLDEQTRGPTWNLDSIQDGQLIGKVYFDKDPVPGADRPAIKQDMLVRLRDDSWPPSAQMLVIGRIVKIEAGSHDRPIVTIEPVQDVSRVSEVMIRVSGSDTTTTGVAP